MKCITIVRSIQFVLNGAGSSLNSPFIWGDLDLPFACTLTGCRLLADQSCILSADIWNAAFLAYPPTIANTIVGGGGLGLTAADHAQINLTGWTTALIAGTLRFKLDTNDNATELTIALTVST